jgi:hypothetical protein
MPAGRLKVRTTTVALAAIMCCASVSAAGGGARGASPAPDPGAVDAVRRYVTALERSDTQAAYALLTPAQQRYFVDVRNYASNYSTTGYRIVSFSIAKTTTRAADLVEVDVAQTASFYDITSERTTTAQVTEPYFALRSGGTWGVKEIYVPWKSYAPKVKATAGGVTAIVDRIEFFDHRVRVYCTLRDLGDKAAQVLPLLRSTMSIGGADLAVLDTADFPLNDEQFFEGVRLYPLHQAVGYMNFPLASKADKDLKVTITIAPVVTDGASSPSSITIGPFVLRKW